MYTIASFDPPSGFSAEPLDMNDAGLVVGILHPSVGNRTHAFAWGSSMSILPDKGFAAEARSVNRTGAVAGAVEIKSGRLVAATWDQAGSLTLLTEPDDAVFSFAHGINDGGAIVGGYWPSGPLQLAGPVLSPGPVQIPLYWANATASPMPWIGTDAQNLWAEALAINSSQFSNETWAVGWSETKGFAWAVDSPTNQIIGGGPGDEFVRIRNPQNDAYGKIAGAPGRWSPPGGLFEKYEGLPGLPKGIANDGNGSDEVVGTVFVPALQNQTQTPFLRRKFRRDEIDTSSVGGLVPIIVQLAAAENVDLNSLLPAQSGWRLTTAVAINNHGEIAGTGSWSNQSRAYRLSPPHHGSSLRFLTPAQAIAIIGQVAAGGGGIGITIDGHIIPMPPPRPDRITEARVEEVLRDALQRLDEAIKSTKDV